MSNADIVETFPEGSVVQITVPALAVYSDGSYGILDANGEPARIQIAEGHTAFVSVPVDPTPEVPDPPAEEPTEPVDP